MANFKISWLAFNDEFNNRLDNESSEEFIRYIPGMGDPRDSESTEVVFRVKDDPESDLRLEFKYGYMCHTVWHGKDITDDLIHMLDDVVERENDGSISILPGKLPDLVRVIEKLTMTDVFLMG